MKRRRFKQTTLLDERLTELAERLRKQAQRMPPGAERDRLIRKARQAEIATQLQVWVTSPGLRPPE